MDEDDAGNSTLPVRQVNGARQTRAAILEADDLLMIGITTFCFCELPACYGNPGQRDDGEDLAAGPPLRCAGDRVTLAAGDCLVQNGTEHAWRNEDSTQCIMAAVAVGAR